jgi:hypothetical protein
MRFFQPCNINAAVRPVLSWFLEENFREKTSGNKEATCCCFVAALPPILWLLPAEEATIWQQVAALKSAILNEVAQMAENLPADIRCNILIGHNDPERPARSPIL